MHDTAMKGLWARLAPWAVAAVLAFAATWLTGRLVALRRENESLRTERLLAELAYKEGQSQLAERSLLAENMINRLGHQLRLAENLGRLKIFALASPAGHTPAAQATVVWDSDQETGLLTAEQLPANSPDQDCQIWVIGPAYPDPVESGVFHVEAGGRLTFAFKPSQPVTQVTAFVVSLEKKGGVPKAAGPILLRGK